MEETFPTSCLGLVDSLGGFNGKHQSIPVSFYVLPNGGDFMYIQILACTCGVIQGLDFLLGFVFLM